MYSISAWIPIVLEFWNSYPQTLNLAYFSYTVSEFPPFLLVLPLTKSFISSRHNLIKFLNYLVFHDQLSSLCAFSNELDTNLNICLLYIDFYVARQNLFLLTVFFSKHLDAYFFCVFTQNKRII